MAYFEDTFLFPNLKIEFDKGTITDYISHTIGKNIVRDWVDFYYNRFEAYLKKNADNFLNKSLANENVELYIDSVTNTLLYQIC